MQQTIVMNECMNRKNKEILRILVQESWKTELWIERYGLGRFQGQNGLFRSFGGICRIFEWLEALARKKRALAKLKIFWGFFVYFWSV
jgi:hypothetical protein